MIIRSYAYFGNIHERSFSDTGFNYSFEAHFELRERYMYTYICLIYALFFPIRLQNEFILDRTTNLTLLRLPRDNLNRQISL